MPSPEEEKLLSIIDQWETEDRRYLDKGHPQVIPSPLDRLEVVDAAPIRSKPRRTYDPSKEDSTPEGSGIPMMLRNIHFSDKENWERLRSNLNEVGSASGLFSDISVRSLGRSKNDPFQLQVKVPKLGRSNLIDVGYGISQMLPLLVNILSRENLTFFLLQQPEVHLHPKAQAELSSLLVEMVRTHDHSFVVETHSDHVVGRAQIEIRRGNIKPEDVSLIYLESSTDRRVVPYNIEFDSRGNFIDVPSSYREFFLSETYRLLGFEQ